MAKVNYQGDFSPAMPTPIGAYTMSAYSAGASIRYAGYTVIVDGDFAFGADGTAYGRAHRVAILSPGGSATFENVSISLDAIESAVKSLDLTGLMNALHAGADTVWGISDARFGGSGNDTFEWMDKGTSFGGPGTDTFLALFSSQDMTVTQTDRGAVLAYAAIGIETTLAGIEKIKFTDKTVDISPAAPLYDFAAAARGAILRGGSSDYLAFSDSKAGTNVGIVSALVAKAEDSTIPAVIAYQDILGRTPSSAQLDSLAGYVSSQINSTGYQSTANPRLGGYEAMGLGLSGTPEFAAKFGGGTEAAMVSAEYQHLFGRAASAAQVDHFVSQIDYFEGLYVGAGISEADAAIKARGAVIGQMLGHAAGEKADIHDAAAAWLGKLADGAAGYGAPLEMI